MPRKKPVDEKSQKLPSFLPRMAVGSIRGTGSPKTTIIGKPELASMVTDDGGDETALSAFHGKHITSNTV
jgi:hypothetical protein